MTFKDIFLSDNVSVIIYWWYIQPCSAAQKCEGEGRTDVFLMI